MTYTYHTASRRYRYIMKV